MRDNGGTNIMKKVLAVVLSAILAMSFSSFAFAEEAPEQFGETEIIVFAAKSLNTVLDQSIIPAYNELQPNVTITPSYDSSGTLMTQIEEGAACDVFFSAAQKQMNELEGLDLVVEGTRADIVNNQVCVVTYKDSGT